MTARPRARPWAGLALLCLAAPARAQQADQPELGYAFPAGGQRGAELTLTLGGQRLEGASAVLLTGEGVTATVERHRAPVRGEPLRKVRDLLQELGQAGVRPRRALERPEVAALLEDLGLDAVDLERVVELQRRRRAPLGQVAEQLAEEVTLRVRVAPDAPLGERELRLVTRRGVTNPLRIRVGEHPEVEEVEPDDREPPGPPLAALPVVVNGRVLPGDVDRVRFLAARGTRLVAALAARSLIPYLADAVPGWFQATLTLRDAAGREVAFSDDFRFLPDPVVLYEVPADGEYVLEVEDALHRGREDFVYRLTLGPLPFVTGAFPLGARAGEAAVVALQGENLPARELRLAPRPAGVAPLPVAGLEPVRFAVDALPAVAEQAGAAVQPVTLPAWVDGRVDAPGDEDVYRFEGRAGQVVVAETLARRLGSPLDSVLLLTTAEGRLVAANDDHLDRGAGLLTHHADSWLRCTLPADGAYLLRLADAQRQGGAAFAYRLRLSAPRPDFALRVTPAAVNAAAGQTVPITVHVLRQDGFTGPVDLALEGAPEGFALAGARVPAGSDAVRLTLTAPTRGDGVPVRLRLVGRAQLPGEARPRVHAAVPAEERTQAFLYRHLVPVAEWWCLVRGGSRGAPRLDAPAGAVALAVGGEAWVRFELGRRPPRGLDRLEVALDEPPAGVTLVSTEADPTGLRLLLRAGAEAQAGLEGNLIAALRLRPAEGEGEGRRGASLGVLPAIPIRLVEGRTP